MKWYMHGAPGTLVEADIAIKALRERVQELEQEIEDLNNELLAAGEYDEHPVECGED